MLSHQKAGGTIELFAFSLACHWMIIRAVKTPCPAKPKTTQSTPVSEVTSRRR